MTFTCLICCDESLYWTIGECEHAVTCLKCTFKM